ncbi:copper homeostasis protein CutC [Pedobacter sp. HMWF019]|uniref:copper homeostasis protein CutC n=1 Tax=Pedobacter sp. HMWF019 TaxID=2056856 RepID=UPI000D364177|nr:copper homeostasis protein CutC [Pedobacter sp. HMWF019]PTS97673.1 copper homeostasis protein CutC [Pedobacter sp. HMWF019]
MINMEVCANSVRSALAAQEGGAIRVELCDNLPEGGTTPSYAQILLAKKMLSLQVYPIIRPRGGDFLYNDLEFELMKEDIQVCKSLNCDGVVIGILNADGSIDKERCKILVDLASPLPVTFHRAFDMSNDLEKALEDVIETGCERILTSGGESSALKGVQTLTKLIKKAAGRIRIMPGAGINESNIAEIIQKTGATEFHASARTAVSSKMTFKNQQATMGSSSDEYSYLLTNSETVKNMIFEANKTL